jgi:NAD-dependent deacetylase
LITQNVDGLHEMADTLNVVRLHGSIWEVLCWRGCDASPPRWRDDSVPLRAIPPRCPHCGDLIRPGVVWFGETLDPDVVDSAQMAADCDVFITVGTSAIVYPAAGFIDVARRHGAFTVEINPEATPAVVDLALRGGAETVLPEIAAQLL